MPSGSGGSAALQDVLTATIDLKGVSYEVVGVARKGFTGHFVGHPSMSGFRSRCNQHSCPSTTFAGGSMGDGVRWLKIIGRLGPGQLRTGCRLGKSHPTEVRRRESRGAWRE